MKSILLAVALVFLHFNQAMAMGDCEKQPWQPQNLKGVRFETRVCLGVHVRNPNDHDLCVRIVSSNGQEWSKWILRAHDSLDVETLDENVQWAVDVTEKTGAHCN